MRPLLWSRSAEIDALSAGARIGLVTAARSSNLPRGAALEPELGRSLFEWNQRLGADLSARERWDAVVRGEGQVVITGQQPALLGGPLYTLYKLATAISLAGWLERATGRPTLALFWLVGDDSDFGEVSGVWTARNDGRLLSLRDEETPAAGSCIGRLEVRRQRAALDRLGALVPPATADRLREATAPVAAAARDWSEFQAAVLHRLLPGRPFLCVDGGSEPVLRAAQPFLRSHAWEEILPELLERGAEAARTEGHEPSFEPQLGRRARFVVRGDRREPLDGTPDAGDLLAPNVVLRPLLQDWLFPNVATVGGPSELRYRAQLGPVYAAAGIREPIVWPRAQIVLAPDGIAAAIPESELERAVTDPDSFVASSITSAMTSAITEGSEPPLLSELDAFRAARNEEWRVMTERLASVDPSLAQLAESARGKADYQAQRVREGLEAKLRQQSLRRQPWILHWRDLVRPRDREQERVLSCVTPWLWGGTGAAEGLLAVTDEDVARRVADGSGATAIVSIETRPEE